MNLIPTGLNRLVALQHRRLEQHYGHNQIRHFQARGLATISLVLGLVAHRRAYIEGEGRCGPEQGQGGEGGGEFHGDSGGPRRTGDACRS